MRISPISLFNFRKQYKKDDVLRLVTGYDYKSSGKIPELMEDLSGVNYQNDKLKCLLKKPTCELAIYEGVHEQCKRKIFYQHPELKEADEAFSEHLASCPSDREALDKWFQAQLYIMPTTYEIKDFRFSPRKFQKDNDKIMKALEKIV